MSKTQQIQSSHEVITEEIIVTRDQHTNTEREESTPLFRKNLQNVLGLTFIAADIQRSKAEAHTEVVLKRDWKALKLSYSHFGTKAATASTAVS